MAKSKARKRAVRSKAASGCGKCYWIWYGKPNNPHGYWLPLECDCKIGCFPRPPKRLGSHKYEVVTAACGPLKVVGARAQAAHVAGAFDPDCQGPGECEYEAKMIDGAIVWTGPLTDCADVTQGCECLGPDWDPEYVGEHAFGRCIDPL